MKNSPAHLWLLLLVMLLHSCGDNPQKNNTTGDVLLLEQVRLIDGNGGTPVEDTKLLIKDGKITAIGSDITDENATVINLEGKTIMPALISAHSHIGTLKGTTTKAENYTEGNILAQLKKYESYGVLQIMAMGTDRPLLFETGLRDRSLKGEIPGARIHSAGYGFGTPNGAPPLGFAMDKVFRPATAAQVVLQVDSLAQLKPDMVKIWVDDFNGKYAAKMQPEIYKAIIQEAHKKNLPVAAHVYYLNDLKQLVADGVDIIAHSVRSDVIDDSTITQMKAKQVIYIPTLSLDEYAYIYGQQPEWINNEFFKRSLEPGVYEMITAEKYRNDLKNAPNYASNMKAFETAKQNLLQLFKAGVLIAMGTDSGATPVRAQGFSEHLELQLMTEAGLTPLEAITVATKNAATALKIQQQYGTLEPAKVADLVILNSDPSKDIKNTREIFAVYKNGKEVSKGPLP
ncbi:amidohydrolase family protein [Niabella yanshanensis]|nr:amidohydrolase family protein [Niabella yanshanensis]